MHITDRLFQHMRLHNGRSIMGLRANWRSTGTSKPSFRYTPVPQLYRVHQPSPLVSTLLCVLKMFLVVFVIEKAIVEFLIEIIPAYQAFVCIFFVCDGLLTDSKITAAAAKTTGPEMDELSAFYAVMGDVLQSEPPRSGAGSSIFAVPTFEGTISSTGAGAVDSPPLRTVEAGAVIPPSIPTLVVPELPSIPTTAKIDKAQLAGIAAAQAAEQLAKAEEKKRKAGQGQPSSVIGIGGGGKKVTVDWLLGVF